jgi:uncharacterized protein (TIGR02118 family)
MTVLRVFYQQGVKFNEDYYVSKHLPMVRGVFRSLGVRSIEIIKALPAGDGPMPTYQFIFSAYFDSESAVKAALHSPQIAPVLRDVPMFFEGSPEIMVGEVMGQAM